MSHMWSRCYEAEYHPDTFCNVCKEERKSNRGALGRQYYLRAVRDPTLPISKSIKLSNELRTNTASLLTKSLRPKEERDARKRHFYERLATVNGIITPSKLPPGETPIRAIYDTSEDRKYACPICGELHKKKYHVQSHFASCAERNGNPRGARWDDACRGTMSHAAVMNTGVRYGGSSVRLACSD